MEDENLLPTLSLKKGMRLHPFLDGSGIVLFDPTRTLVSSLNVSVAEFTQWLNSPNELDEGNQRLLDTLIHQGFVLDERAEHAPLEELDLDKNTDSRDDG